MLTPQPQLEIHDPDKIGLFRKTLGEDLSNPHRIRYCKVLIDMAAKEIVEREGRRQSRCQGLCALGYRL